MLQDALDYLTDSHSWWGHNGLVWLTWQHLRLSGAAVLAAVIAAVPPALWLGHRRQGGYLAISLVNLSRALPTFAVIAFVFPISLEYGFGLGFWPTFLALFLLALPPIFVNTYTGVSDLSDDVVEAARAMGMREREVLRSVELPAAMPLIATGVRVSAVQVVATTTLGALVGFRCLGTPILQAIATSNDGQLIVAALLVAAVSLLTEAAFGILGRRLTPWRPGPAPHREPVIDRDMRKEPSMKKRTLLIAILAMFALFAAACGDDDTAPASSATRHRRTAAPAPPPPPPTDRPSRSAPRTSANPPCWPRSTARCSRPTATTSSRSASAATARCCWARSTTARST